MSFDWFERKMFQGDHELLLLLGKNADQLAERDKHLLFNSCVEIVNLELSSYCNRRCDYCPVSTSVRKDTQQLMDQALLESIVSDLKKINFSKSISLNLYNEPLCNDNFLNQLAYIRKELPLSWLQFNSNGDYLDSNVMGKLAEVGLNSICVTIHPPPNKEYGVEDLEKRMAILLRQLDKTELMELVSVALQSELNHITFNILGVALKIQWPNWRKVGSSRGGVIKQLDEDRAVRTAPCARPFREFTIYFDGTVTPCCEVFYDADGAQPLSIGTLRETSLFSIYADSRMSSFRKTVFLFGEKEGVCQYCPVADNSLESQSDKRVEIYRKASD